MSNSQILHRNLFPQPVLFVLILFLLLVGCAQNTQLASPTTSPSPTVMLIETSVPLPDLSIQSITMEGLTGDYCDLDTTRLSLLVEVNNIGLSAAGPFAVEAGGQVIRIAEGLGAGESIQLQFPFTQEEITGIADVDAEIDESNEENNQLSIRLQYPVISPECFINPTTTSETISSDTTLEGHSGVILSLDFSNNGNLLASGSIDNTMRLWQMTNKVLLRTMQDHPFPVHAIEFSADGNYLVTGSTDGLIRIWNVSDGRLLSTLRGHGGYITDIDISPDSKRIASSSDDFTVRIWRFQDGRLLRIIDEGMTKINDISYSPNGIYLAWAEEIGIVRIWDAQNNTWFRKLSGTEAARSLAFSPDGEILAVGYSNGVIKLWQVQNGILIQELTGHQGSVSSLVYSPDEGWLLSGSTDGTLIIWQPTEVGQRTLVQKFTLEGHTGPVTSIAIDPSSEIIASGSEDSTIKLWVIPTPTPAPPG